MPPNKKRKGKIDERISEIKSTLNERLSLYHPLQRELNKKRGKLKELENQIGLKGFEQPNTEKEKQLREEIKELEDKVSKMKDIQKHAFEWHIEFPDVLNNEGDFIGFDAIIGNPPYIQLQSMHEMTDVYKEMNYQTFAGRGDIYCLFYELRNNLLRLNSFLLFITSNLWMTTDYGIPLRQYLLTLGKIAHLMELTCM